ncbi:unnamed protein product [Oppiella nova]|uniref:Uncharacterized protein n=1 Tax=Oppiella nova TaxID=334625 RepID=A0A7R9LRM1_9ACAR|nr:unnamed protein product [Oppiella nova]CAG2166251.1 unnamed protein product [Oppiella nova]
MYTNSEYEKIAVIVILSGCGLAIALAFAPKYSRYGCPNSIVVFERQTTTSDENNIDYNSGCFEDSFYQREAQCDSDTNADTGTVSSPNTVIAAQTHHTYATHTPPSPQTPPQRSSSPQVKFAPRPPLVKNRKTSLPCKLVSIQTTSKTENTSTDSEGQRRASAGIIRQKSFEDIEEDITYNNQMELSERRRRNSLENKTISTDVLRKQYRELWQLRATFEAEELDTSDGSAGAGDRTPPPNQQQKLIKNDSGIHISPYDAITSACAVDSGYKSIERRDYSIDIKSDYMFRQFTTTSATTIAPVAYPAPPTRHQITHQQSIKEEQESDIQATFV